MMKILFFIVSFIVASSTYAEVYKWTDANGKVHYSDQKPEDQKKVKDVTNDIKKPNTDSSQKETQKMETIFRKENVYDQAHQQQQAQADQAHEEKCADAKQYLAKLNRRVVMRDEDGQEVRMTEAERRVKAEELRQRIADECPE